MQRVYAFIIFLSQCPYFLSQSPKYYFVAIPEKIVSMNLRPVADWMKRQIFR